ncbi:TetM/TetW/TetO/TetS family tetracycline resistance ribosomal protection protein [Collinsella tanakaei]|uniref:TetM/TetW/TetO/TetS family tetracycline resistance ribosomal protection protein n=1 Tax=Collinsella tanakaei TaxID=626935 RepID=UPI0022E63606|nr:TetM/TetW/TetO/TetS family tetracycline resistance ribosomal protection protein [Collinsella tanakaei]
MSQAVIGFVAHVDAGKTTLAEALLYRAGAIRRQGRVDKGDAHLDTDAMERERGITIFSKQTSLDWAGAHVMLLDTPGHVDFSAEAERTLQALDYAVLIVGANDGVEGHTETLWSLLARYNVPTFVFVNKLDLAADGLGPVMDEMHRHLSPSVVDGDALAALVASAGGAGEGAAALLEDVAATDEDALDEYLESGSLSAETIRRLIVQRKVFPCFAGSALRMEGIEEFLDGVVALVQEKTWPDEFAARVYRVSRGAHGERLAWVKVTGGVLRAKEQLSGFDRGATWNEKVDQVRIYDADSFEIAREVPAGRVCAVTGLSQVLPGSALGAEARLAEPAMVPVLSYSVSAAGADATALVQALRELADEDPLLGVAWHEQLQEVHVQLMGEVQREVVARQLLDRFGLEVTFGAGGILYRETVTAPVRGAGHFEPLRHYAEVQLLVEPAERGAGVEAGTRALEDDLDRNWQRLILTHVLEREHPGVLTGAPLTDVRITLLGGRAHLKHTEGGDFRQATYRAIRQALMTAREQGACQLLEPWYRFRLGVPADKVGRALADLQRMGADFDAPVAEGDRAEIAGSAPASEIGSYALEVSAYSGGRGRLFLEYAGYRPCHNAEQVIADAAYDPVADLANTPDSVFCSHGAGYNVAWDQVPVQAHVEIDFDRLRPWRKADASFFAG